tara:strand:- start:5 stop:667 length:663 start_codon:yes stop_codon:yes gene_type:complete
MPVTAKFRVGDTHKWEFDTRYGGAVLEVGSRTVQVMSDIWDTQFYAKVWDEATGKPLDVSLYYANESSREESQKCVAVVDATSEVRAKFDRFVRNRAIDANYTRALAATEVAVMRIAKGDTVKVVRGRSGMGTVGKVVVEYLGTYNAGYHSSNEYKYAIATSDRTETAYTKDGQHEYQRHLDVVWAWARNCEKVDVPEIDKDAILEEVIADYDSTHQKAA